MRDKETAVIVDLQIEIRNLEDSQGDLEDVGELYHQLEIELSWYEHKHGRQF